MQRSTMSMLLGSAVLVSVVGCVLLFRLSRQAPGMPSQRARSLLDDLDSRRTWPIDAVKLNKREPELTRTLHRGEEAIRVDAWLSNDYGVPMLRAGEGPLLFELTRDEFEALRRSQ
jgi:hypothetical protein